jgi:hypothetical protein
MEVTARFDIPNNSYERLRIDQFLEGDVIEFQLAGNTHHDTIEAAFSKSTVPANTELAAEHDVECMRFGTPCFIAKLQPNNLPAASSLSLVFITYEFGKHLAELNLRNRYVAVVVSWDTFELFTWEEFS